MKTVIFYFEDGTYIKVYGYGKTDTECIYDASTHLTEASLHDVININCYNTPIYEQ